LKKEKKENIQKFQGLNLYVKHLEDTVDDTQLRQIFSKFGKITSAVVMRDHLTKISKGFGFICFSTSEEATKALNEMNSKIIGSKPLYVSIAQRKEIRRQELEIQYSQRQNSLRSGIQQQLSNQNMYQPQLFYQQNNIIQPRSGIMYQNFGKPKWTNGNLKQQQNYNFTQGNQKTTTNNNSKIQKKKKKIKIKKEI